VRQRLAQDESHEQLRQEVPEDEREAPADLLLESKRVLVLVWLAADTLFEEHLRKVERGLAHDFALFFFFDLLLDLAEVDHGVDGHEQHDELDVELAEDGAVLAVVRGFVVPEVELDDLAEALVEREVDVVEEGESG
jgi:hypothetical protein